MYKEKIATLRHEIRQAAITTLTTLFDTYTHTTTICIIGKLKIPYTEFGEDTLTNSILITKQDNNILVLANGGDYIDIVFVQDIDTLNTILTEAQARLDRVKTSDTKIV